MQTHAHSHIQHMHYVCICQRASIVCASEYLHVFSKQHMYMYTLAFNTCTSALAGSLAGNWIGSQWQMWHRTGYHYYFLVGGGLCSGWTGNMVRGSKAPGILQRGRTTVEAAQPWPRRWQFLCVASRRDTLASSAISCPPGPHQPQAAAEKKGNGGEDARWSLGPHCFRWKGLGD